MEKKKYKYPIKNILKNKPTLSSNLGNAHYHETLFSIKLLLFVKWTNAKQYKSLVMGRVQKNGLSGDSLLGRQTAKTWGKE